MRHGILASVTIFALVCLAVGDEPKRSDDQIAAETDDDMNDKDYLAP